MQINQFRKDLKYILNYNLSCKKGVKNLGGYSWRISIDIYKRFQFNIYYHRQKIVRIENGYGRVFYTTIPKTLSPAIIKFMVSRK